MKVILQDPRGGDVELDVEFDANLEPLVRIHTLAPASTGRRTAEPGSEATVRDFNGGSNGGGHTENIVGVQTAAEEAGVSQTRLYRAIRTQQIPGVRQVEGRWVFTPRSIERAREMLAE